MAAQPSAPASPVNSSQPAVNQNRRQSTGMVCNICKGVTKAGQHSLRCLHCGDCIHLACQYKLFKDAGNDALKNKLDWLSEYIRFAALAYRCKACKEKFETAPTDATPLPRAQISEEMDAVKQSIASLDIKIEALHKVVVQLGPTNCDIAAPNSKHMHRQVSPTYAAAVSADLVKTAVSEAIREQQKASTARASVVVYGFPEEGKDNVQLLDMFDFINCRCDIVRHTRIGRDPRQSKTSSIRPVRVELRSISDTNLVLSRAKHLRRDTYYSGVFINKWLSDEELKCVKQLRHQCDVLNAGHPHNNTGCKQFIVISNKIMERNASGRLQPYNSPLDHQICNATGKTNGADGTVQNAQQPQHKADSSLITDIQGQPKNA